MMTNNLIYLIKIVLLFWSTVLIKNIYDKLFQSKYEKNWLIWLTYFLFLFTIGGLQISTFLKCFGHFFSLLVLSSLGYFGNRRGKIRVCYVIVLFFFFSHFLVIFLMKFPFFASTLFPVAEILSQIFLIVVFIIAKKRLATLCTWIQEKENLLRFGYVVFASFFSIYGLFKYGVFSYEMRNEPDMLFIILSLVMLLSIIYTVYCMHKKLILEVELRQQELLSQRELRMCIEFLNEKKRANEESLKIRHDLKNQLIFLQGLMASEAYNQTKKMLDKMLLEVSVHKEISRTKCLLIDTLINYKYALASQEGIVFIMEISPVISKEFDEMLELSVILGNALDNAIEAAKKLVKISDKVIKIYIFESKGILSIKVVNNFNGEISIEYSQNVFCLSVLLYGKVV